MNSPIKRHPLRGFYIVCCTFALGVLLGTAYARAAWFRTGPASVVLAFVAAALGFVVVGLARAAYRGDR